MRWRYWAWIRRFQLYKLWIEKVITRRISYTQSRTNLNNAFRFHHLWGRSWKVIVSHVNFAFHPHYLHDILPFQRNLRVKCIIIWGNESFFWSDLLCFIFGGSYCVPKLLFKVDCYERYFICSIRLIGSTIIGHSNSIKSVKTKILVW